jgi:hypothetical protein
MIDSAFHNAYVIGEIEHNPDFQAWRDSHGFTTKELACI